MCSTFEFHGMLYLGEDGAKDRGLLEVEGGFEVGDLEFILVVLGREPHWCDVGLR